MKILIFLVMWLLVEIAFKVFKQKFSTRGNSNSRVLDDLEFLKNWEPMRVHYRWIQIFYL